MVLKNKMQNSWYSIHN